MMIPLLRALLVALLVMASGCAGASSTLPGAPSSLEARAGASALTYGVYAWNAQDVFTRWRAGTLWSYLASEHVDDVLLGFTDHDIAKYSKPQGAATIN